MVNVNRIRAIKNCNTMKIYRYLALAAISMLLFASCVHSGDLDLDPVPDIGFTYSSDGLTLTFTSSTEGTTGITWATSDGGTGSGESLSHKFPSPDTYWIEMKGTLNGKEQRVSTKVIVAKPAIVSVTDNSLSDWDKVKYEDFIFTGSENGVLPIVEGKADYDANWLYLYLALDTKLAEEKAATGYICDLSIDGDDDIATGFEVNGIGGEYLVEGCFFGQAWYDFYHGTTGADWWDDGTLADPKYSAGFVLGHEEQDGNVIKVELAIKRDTFGITGTKCAIQMTLFNDDWSDLDYLMFGGVSDIHLSLDKTE